MPYYSTDIGAEHTMRVTCALRHAAPEAVDSFLASYHGILVLALPPSTSSPGLVGSQLVQNSRKAAI